MGIAYMAVSVLFIVFLYLRIRDQDRLIKDLMDRLAARNHAEYVASKGFTERPPDDKPAKRLSWYDDPMEDEQ
ncbi:hypothetical protein ACIFQM_17555 [Paenibacillus sp. NRS-1782]|uniref:hypothetical protein n=1 Tax=unclassified Paenibacillus TaxID=185978 RepID=UPI003D292E7F